MAAMEPLAQQDRPFVSVWTPRVDGVRPDLATAVSRCRAAGAADLTATGAAIVGAIRELLLALKDAGVVVRASPDLWRVAGLAGATEGSPR
jgi:hypothetical protein